MQRAQQLFLACLALLSLCSGPVYAQQKWAIVIGIDQYNDSRINPLHGACNDARGLKDALVNGVGVPDDYHLQLLVSDDKEKLPTRANILQALLKLNNNEAIKPEDTVFIFVSCHGLEVDGVSYLLPWDTISNKDTILPSSALATSDIRSLLQAIPAQKLVLAFDMCRNAPVSDRTKGLTDSNTLGAKGQDFINLTQTTNDRRVVVTFLSCSANQRAYESQTGESKGRGYFSYYLEQALRGDREACDSEGKVTAARLEEYLTRKVASAVQFNEKAEQTPYPKFEGASAGRLVLLQKPLPNETSPVPDAPPKTDTPQINRNAVLRVISHVPGASIRVDGVSLKDNTYRYDLSDQNIPSLNVTVEIVASGYQRLDRIVTLEPGKESQLLVVEQGQDVKGDKDVWVMNRLNAAPVARTAEREMPATPILTTNPVDGAEMVQVPSGPFEMGDDDDADIRQSNPGHRVTLAAYYLYKTPVTVGMYEKFVAEMQNKKTRRADGAPWTMPPAPDFNPAWTKKDQPMVNVTWEEANAYCRWAGGRLPTEAQWEKAARGTDGRTYPWGNDWDPNRCAYKRKAPVPVGSIPTGASPYGALDMVGNVWQWCDDFLNVSRTQSILRGGAWNTEILSNLHTAYRDSNDPSTISDSIGFRCMIPAE